MVRADEFDYSLPLDLIAQHPAPERSASRLLVLRHGSGLTEHRPFLALFDYLRAGDVLVLNDSKVIPARLRAVKTGPEPGLAGRVELFLLEPVACNDWWVMLRPGKRVRPGTRMELLDVTGKRAGIVAVARAKNAQGHCRVSFQGVADIMDCLESIGEVPLPPYVRRTRESNPAVDRERYQTVYANPPGSVAAPTAGLHFSSEMLKGLEGRGVRLCHVTLHAGYGTFAPVKTDDIRDHVMHEERFSLGAAAVDAIQAARAAGARVFAVGTTSVRVLESVAAMNHGHLVPTEGRTRIFIHPPFHFHTVDGLLTNFHLPRSTLLMLVCAFASDGNPNGRAQVLAAYAEAVRERYRFYSYGDAMLIL
jgi:S-adenosylmethionine:tRNA ribosyltransferase-isomerase